MAGNLPDAVLQLGGNQQPYRYRRRGRPAAATGLLFAYLIFFAIDGELPVIKDNRAAARSWIEQSIEPGRSVLLGQYSELTFPGDSYRLVRRWGKNSRLSSLDAIVLHEALTYRYDRSRLSPLGKPASGNIDHDDLFCRNHRADLRAGRSPFALAEHFPVAGQSAPERAIYKRYWGTFQSFVGDTWIYRCKEVAPADAESTPGSRVP